MRILRLCISVGDLSSCKYISWKRLDNATDAGAFGAFVTSVGGFADDTVEDGALGALAVDASNLPGVPTVPKPGSSTEKNIIIDGGFIYYRNAVKSYK